MENLKLTESGKSYWNHTGAYQPEYNRLYVDLVPSSGCSETLNGELVRAISRLSYEFYNNGNCNACEQEWGIEREHCYDCGGSGESSNCGEECEEEVCEECCGSGTTEEDVVVNVTVNDFYGALLNLIDDNIKGIENETEGVREIIIGDLYNSKDQFNETNQDKYNLLFDKVVHYVLNSEDKELSSEYKSKMQ